MQTLHVIRSAGPDGAIHLTIPVGQPGEYQVQVAWSPRPLGTVEPAVDDQRWPAGYFERLARNPVDDDFVRPEQGITRSPPSFE